VKKSVQKPRVAVVMGSESDWSTMKPACEILESFDVPYTCRLISAHRTPHRVELLLKAYEDSLQIIIAGAGGAAHLAGAFAARTILPVLGVPVQSKALNGLDSLLSTVQMPGGISVPTFTIGEAGAKNAALTAVAILALTDQELARRLRFYRMALAQAVPDVPKGYENWIDELHKKGDKT